MKYSQVSYGSSGSDVKTLQEMLNNNGYSLDVDGNFGPKTQAAVKDYQKKNSLAVDGIVGSNTWGTLTKAANTSNTAPAATTTAPTYENKAYQPSDAVTQAEALLNQQMQQKPGAYQSAYQGQLNDIVNQILNREQFSYDLNSDALYQQYADQYATRGKLASMDVMGQAAAMTGGYGNSYAQSVGQQTYQGYLQQLNDVVPELYQMALNQYNQEGQNLYNQASLLGAQEEQEYGRYRDQVSDFYTQLQQAYDQYNAERDYDYSKYTDERNFGYEQYLNDLNYQYQQERDKVADDQWQKEYDFALQQYNDSKNSSGYRGSGDDNGTRDSGDDTGDRNDTGTGSSNYDPVYSNNGYSADVVMEAQRFIGATLDGLWGPNSAAKAKAMGYNSLADVVKAMENQPSTKNTGFTGSTYSEAVAYLKANGVPGTSASGIMTENEWQRRKSSYQTYGTGGAEVKNYKTYKEYIADIVEYKLENG